MADTNSDDDLIIISEKGFKQEADKIPVVSEEVKSDDGDECLILDQQSGEEEEEDLIVLDSIDNGTSSLSNESAAQDNNSLEVISENLSTTQEYSRTHNIFTRKVLELQSTIKSLQEENMKLKEETKELTIDIELVHDQKPRIIINDKEFERKHRSAIESFINKLLESEAEKKCVTPSQEEFFVDRFMEAKTSDAAESWSIPLYEQVYNSPLLGNSQEDLVEVDSPDRSFGVSCFNCNGNHCLNECPEPLDRLKISQNRRNFQTNSAKSGPSSKRYHLQAEFDVFKAGEISQNLRSALNLKSNQLPPYIYRMRVLGYPPGWLREAEIQSSGLTLFDTEGNVGDEEGKEDGEIDPGGLTVQYDRRKLVDYPGFNLPIPSGFLDESKQFGMPSLRRQQSRTEMERTMKTPEPYKRRKAPNQHRGPRKKQRHEPQDMEIELISESEVSPKRILGENAPLPRGESSSKSSQSPTLTDLEDAKQKLMEELEDEEEVEVTRTQFTVLDSISDSEGDCPSISRTLGTPIMVKHSPYERLPDSSKFALGVTEHMPFENLPNSTGVYDKMKKVIRKVKDRIQQLN